MQSVFSHPICDTLVFLLHAALVLGLLVVVIGTLCRAGRVLQRNEGKI